MVCAEVTRPDQARRALIAAGKAARAANAFGLAAAAAG
jgi:hypothetical protein